MTLVQEKSHLVQKSQVSKASTHLLSHKSDYKNHEDIKDLLESNKPPIKPF